MSPPTPAEMLTAVNQLSKQYEESSKANESLAEEFGRRKRETRWIALGVVVVVCIAVCAWLVVRRNDRQAEAERARNLAGQVYTQRENQREGCERQNDVRRTLVAFVNAAVGSPTPVPVPEGLSPELQELFRQSQERTQKLREQLLALPGVQRVDCLAAYPPLPIPE